MASKLFAVTAIIYRRDNTSSRLFTFGASGKSKEEVIEHSLKTYQERYPAPEHYDHQVRAVEIPAEWIIKIAGELKREDAFSKDPKVTEPN